MENVLLNKILPIYEDLGPFYIYMSTIDECFPIEHICRKLNTIPEVEYETIISDFLERFPDRIIAEAILSEILKELNDETLLAKFQLIN